MADFLSFFPVFTGLELGSGGNIKKIILIILGIIILGAGIYFIFFYKAKVIITTDPNNAQIAINNKVGVGTLKVNLMPGKHRLKITLDGYIPFDQEINSKISQTLALNIKLRVEPKPEKLVNFPVSFPALSQDGLSLLYLSNGGKTIYKLNSPSLAERPAPYPITPDVFTDINQIIWQPSRELAIIKHADGGTSLYDFNRYDLLHQENFDWGKDMRAIAWKNDGEKIIYYYTPATGEQSLIRANKDNSSMERFFDMRPYNLNNPKIIWSADGQKLLLVTNKIYVFDLYTKSLTGLEKITGVVDANFTPDNQNIIYQTNDSLATADLDGSGVKALDIKTTLDNIVWFDESHFIYAQKNGQTNTFAKFSLATQEKIDYDYGGNESVNATNLMLSADKSMLFFTNNNYLYSLKLENKQY